MTSSAMPRKHSHSFAALLLVHSPRLSSPSREGLVGLGGVIVQHGQDLIQAVLEIRRRPLLPDCLETDALDAWVGVHEASAGVGSLLPSLGCLRNVGVVEIYDVAVE